MKNIAILASGNGTNAENLARIFNEGTRARVVLVLTNRKNAGVIQRMKLLDVPVQYVPNSVWDNNPEEVVRILRDNRIDLVVLAGFMHYVSPAIIQAFRNRIVNIHPSLLPKFGGKGMYGHYVHEAVVNAGETESGVTVHYVTEEMDGGDIIMQQRVVVTPEDTAETLEAKIHPVEYNLYPRAIMAALNDQKAETPPAFNMPETPPVFNEPETPPTFNKPETSPTTPPPSSVEPLPAPEERPEKPGSYLVWSILSLVFCCLPLGIVALIYGAQVDKKYYRGDYHGAEQASRMAQAWIIAAFVVGVLWGILFWPLTLLLDF